MCCSYNQSCRRISNSFLEAGMGILATAADERVADVSFDQDTLSVRLKDGRTISVPWHGIQNCSMQPPSNAAIGRLLAADTVSTGQTSTKTSAPRACCGERPLRLPLKQSRLEGAPGLFPIGQLRTFLCHQSFGMPVLVHLQLAHSACTEQSRSSTLTITSFSHDAH